MKNTKLYTTYYLSPIGKLLIIADNEALFRLDFENEKTMKIIENLSANNEVVKIYPHSLSPLLPPILEETKNWLDAYFNRKMLPSAPRLRFEDTSFRMLVWNLLLNIPYGETVSYKEMANMVAKERGIKKMSAQAIGQAVGHNPISIIVPCHRVIGAKGELIGYAGGLIRKQFLLELEKQVSKISFY